MHDVGLTPDLYFAAEIEKFENQPDGSVVVYGCPANPETLDNDDQIADSKWLKEALPAWYHTYGNVREMHQPSAVGAAKKLEWKDGKPKVAAKVVDPIAATKVREGVYKAFSIGVKKPELAYDRNASGGRIVGGKIVEVSLVDRPSIPGSDIESFKAAVAGGFMLCKAVGANEWLDTQMGVVIADDTLDRATSGGEMSEKSAAADQEKRDFDPNVGGGVDRDTIPADDFAGRNRSYPIVKPGDVSDAASSIGRAGEDNYSPEKLRENIIRIARRKGAAYVAELPEAWRDTSDEKAASADDAKGVPAPSDTVKEASPEMSDEDKTVDGDAAKTADASTEKTTEPETAKSDQPIGDSDLDESADKSSDLDSAKGALEAIEKAQAESAYCQKCASMQKIADGQVEKVGSVEMLVGKCAAGHDLRKVVATAATKTADTENSTAYDEVEKTVDVEKAEDVAKSDDTEKASDADTVKDAADGDSDTLGEAADTDTTKALEAAVDKVADDTVKAALVDLLKDAGIDLGKIGARMAKARLDRFSSALDELSELAKELVGDEDGEKAASAGGPTLADGSSNLAVTRFVSAVKVVNQLARQLVPGDGTFDLDANGHEGPDPEMGTAQQIRIRDRIDENQGKHASPDLTKAQIVDEAAKLVAPELAKSVAREVETLFAPLRERLEKVEHTVKPASPPVLVAADRGHALNGDTTKAAQAEEAMKADLEKRLGHMSDQDREALLATVLTAARR